VQTIADDLLLVLLDETGKPRVDRTKMDYALAGAVLLELALDHRIDVLAGPPRKAAVVVIDARPLEDEILDGAVREVDARRRRADRLVPVVSKGLRRRLLDRAQRNGMLRAEHKRVLGLIPVERWPAVDPRPRSHLLRRLREVLVDGATPDPRISALVALLSSVQAAHLVVGPLPRGERKAVRRRAKEIGQGAWAADAVRKAVEAVQTAVAAGTAGAVVAVTTASS
jgi:hypothetical protein